MQGLSGLGGLGASALQPAQASPAASGLQAQGMPGMDLSTITSDLPDSWLSPDLKSGTIDWSVFNPINATDYSSYLNTSYKPGPSGGPRVLRGTSLTNFIDDNKKQKPPETYRYFNAPLTKSVTANPYAFNASSAQQVGGLDQAMQDLANKKLADGRSKLRYVDTNVLNFKDKKLADAINSLDLNPQRYLQSSISEQDALERQKRLDSASSAYGIPVEELAKQLNVYEKAYNTLADPVGANWQDLKNTGDFYKNTILPGVRKYSGYSNSFFDNLEKEASEGTRNEQKYLSPEYYALHTVSKNVNYRNNNNGELVGNINPYYGDWTDPNFTNSPVIQRKSAAAPGVSRPYIASNWTDYLDNNTNIFTATEEQKNIALKEAQKQKDFLLKKVQDGGQFNLWRETGTNPNVVTKVKGGGKWKPRNSGYTNQLNIAQNYLPQATEGKRNFKDAGFDEDTAYRSGFYFQKPKQSGFGKFAGPLLALASFVPGPIGVGARVLNTVNSLANKDYVGALTSGLGAYGKLTGTNVFGGMAGKVGSVLSNAGINVSPAVANAIVQGGIGGLGALANKGSFVKGALGGGLGSYGSGIIGDKLASLGVNPTMAGVISGGAGGAINGTIQGARGLPLLSGVATGAISGFERGRNIRNNRARNVRR